MCKRLNSFDHNSLAAVLELLCEEYRNKSQIAFVRDRECCFTWYKPIVRLCGACSTLRYSRVA